VIVTTLDPVTGNRVTDLGRRPFVVVGNGLTVLIIVFKSVDIWRACLLAHPDDTGLFEDDFTYHS